MNKDRDSLYEEEDIENQQDMEEDAEEFGEEYEEDNERESIEIEYEDLEAELHKGENEDDEPDDTQYIKRLFEYLRQALESGTSVPLTTKKLVDVDECLKILDDMQNNLPDGIQYGWKLHDEKARILNKAVMMAQGHVENANARIQAALDKARIDADELKQNAQSAADETIAKANEQADAILREASEEADRMVSESEVMMRAKKEATELRDAARAEAKSRRQEAVNDAYLLLDSFEKQLVGIANEFERKKNDLYGGSRR